MAEAVTDADGRFRVSDLPGVPFNLRVVKGGDYEDYDHSELLDPSDPNQFRNGRKFLTIQLEGHQTVLTGSVRTPDGKPVAGATVRTYPATVPDETDEYGTYEIRSGQFDSGVDYRVEATHPRYRSELSEKLQLRVGEQNEVGIITLVPYELSNTGIVPGVVDNTGAGSGDVTQGDQ